jgi:CheY-like chemotaxis protein
MEDDYYATIEVNAKSARTCFKLSFAKHTEATIKLRVFYLDDEAALCQIFSEFYAPVYISVETFTDPEISVEACNNETSDAFFIDYRLPGYAGDEVANAVPSEIRKILVTGDLSVPELDQFELVVKKSFNLKADREMLGAYL